MLINCPICNNQQEYTKVCEKCGYKFSVQEINNIFECCKNAVEQDENNAYALVNLGECYEKGIGIVIGKEKAFKCYEKAINIDASNIEDGQIWGTIMQIRAVLEKIKRTR